MGGGSSKVDTVVTTKCLCKEAIRGAETVKDKQDTVLETFRSWDLDGTGFITAKELAHVFKDLGVKVSTKDIKKIMSDMDWNSDGAIDFSELSAWLFMAPHMTKFFKTAEAINQCATDKLHGAKTFGQVAEVHRATNEEMVESLTPLMEQSFAFHDKSDSGVLERDESILFFSNYIDRLIPFVESQAVYTLRFDAWDVGDEALDVPLLIEKLRERMKVIVAEYKKCPDERIRESFNLVDSNGDGMLQRSEVLASMVLGTPGSHAFLSSLGFLASRDELQALIESVDGVVLWRPPPLPANVIIDDVGADGSRCNAAWARRHSGPPASKAAANAAMPPGRKSC